MKFDAVIGDTVVEEELMGTVTVVGMMMVDMMVEEFVYEIGPVETDEGNPDDGVDV